MRIREEKVPYNKINKDLKLVLQIRNDSWEDEYGSQKFNSDVYYKIVSISTGTVIQEKIVTPQHLVLSDIFDCPVYFNEQLTILKKEGWSLKIK